MLSPRPFAAAALALAALSAAGTAQASHYTLSPGMTQAAVAAVLDGLMPGDTLALMPGAYQGVDLDLMHKDMSGIAGTAAAPITITGTPDAGGNLPHVVADTGNYQEAVRLRPGCAYLTLQNLHLSAVGSQTQAGIFVDSGVHDITITGNVIENVTGIGIQMQTQSDVHDFLIQQNTIYDTGTNTSDGNNGGQAFTAGGFDSTTATTNVYHLTFRNNLVHDNRGQEGDCIKLMYGVFASTIEDNVSYNCPRGVSGETENYGITSYGSGVGHYANAADDNVVQRNLVVGTASCKSGHSNVAIYAGPGTLVLDNVVIDSNQGIAARLESEAAMMRNLSVVNNTVYGATDNAFSIRGCQQADSSVVVTGNALVAVSASGYGYRMPDPTGAMVARANYYQGQDYAEAAPPVMNKLTAALSAIFVNPTTKIPGADLMPAAGSPLIDSGDPPTAPPLDFDLAMRPQGAGPDVGAYESRPDLSSHWPLSLTLKLATTMSGVADSCMGAGGGSQGAGGAGSGPAQHSGCGCSVPGEPAAHAAWLALAALLALRRPRSAPRGSRRRRSWR